MFSSAQPICQITDFTAENGLPQDIASAVLQDQKGFIWICTRNGLNKFDGYTFKNYKSAPHKEYTLSNNRITFISETAYGDIWCQTYDSKAYIFDTHLEIFYDVLQTVDKNMQRRNFVQKIFPLKEGIAWVTCDKGYCYRIDEKRYKEKDGITLYSTFNGFLKGEHIFTIFQDSDKDEWILTDKGISIIGNKKIDSDFPFQFIQEYNGTIYLASASEKIAYYNQQTESIKFIEFPYPINKISSLDITNHGLLTISTDNGVILFNPENKTSQLIDIRTPMQSSNEAISIYEDKEGELWIFPTTPGVIRFNPATGEKQYLFTPPKEVVNYGRENKNTIFEDKQGTLWLIPHNGNFCYYDRKSKELKAFYTDPDNPQSLFAPLVRYHYQDRQGNYWLASARGIKKMSFYPQIYNLKGIDRGFEIRAFLLDSSQRLWVASKSEYVRIYHPDGSLAGYLSSQGKISKDKVSFNASVYSICEGKNGTIWIGTKGNGLFQLTKKADGNYNIQNYVYDSEDLYSLSYNDIFTIYSDNHDNIWVGCYGGGLNLLQQTPEGKVYFINHRNKLQNYPFSTCHNIRYITGTENGILLVGTTFGLVTFSNDFAQPEEIKFYRNIQNRNNPFSLTGNDIMHIYKNSHKDIYILTFTGGVNKITSRTLLSENIEFQYYTEQEGLGSDMVLSMIEDSQKNLWIASENALSKFNPETEAFENYSTGFLRQKMNFSEAIPTINARQQLIFGTDMGFLEIVPEQMKKSDYVPPIVFTDLKVNGKKSTVSTDDLKEIALHPSERNINVQFSALDFTRPDDIRYAYRLEGLEKEWNYSDKNKSASYINLPAGEYRLQVKSTNSDGVWVNNIRTLSIKVIPTFWETPWALLAYLAAFILLTGLILYIFSYIYRLRHQVNMEQQLSNIKLKFFTDISHELRTPLTLISSPVSEVLEDQTISPSVREHLTVVHKNTERMLRLVNQILDFRKIQNKKMKVMVEQTELIAFLMKITENFRLIAEEKQIDFTFKADQEEVYIWIDRDKVEKIVFNLLSNAFKYTSNEKRIILSVTGEKDHLYLQVKDEGRGINAQKINQLFTRFETLDEADPNLSTGIGLSLVKELLNLLHGTIKVDSKLGEGSTFSVRLPGSYETFSADSNVEFILNDSENSELQRENEGKLIEDENKENRILIIEDNEELRHFICNVLSKDYVVFEAENGKQGLDKALAEMPDIVISDIMMPEMDGIEFLKRVKANSNICHIPVILLSAKSSLSDQIQGLEYGADEYITKPFSSTYLKAKVDSLFKQRQMLYDYYTSKIKREKITNITDQIESATPQVTHFDDDFIRNILQSVEENIHNPDFKIDDLAEAMGMSRTVFYRKMKSLMGVSPVDFMKSMRIKRAVQLLEQDQYTVSEVGYMSGFATPQYFSKVFKETMNCTPKEYKLKKHPDELKL